MTRRPGTVFAAGLLLLAHGGLPETPAAQAARLPYSIRIEVFYGREKNRAEYPEELQRRLVRALIGCEAYASVGSTGDEDLVARVVLDGFEVDEDKAFLGPATGGPGEFVKLSATVIVTGDISVVTASEAVVVPPKRFHHATRAAPVMAGDDPLPRALSGAYEDVVGWVEKYLCRGREKIHEGAVKAGLPALQPATP